MNQTVQSARQIADCYIAVWNETDAARRSVLLAEGWEASATYADPMMQARGREHISALIGAVHERFPGFRFALDGQPDAYTDKIRFSWMLGPADQADMIKGTDFAVVADGRLSSVTGFLDKVPTSAETGN